MEKSLIQIYSFISEYFDKGTVGLRNNKFIGINKLFGMILQQLRNHYIKEEIEAQKNHF